MIHCYIVDDHPIVNSGLVQLLDKPSEGISVIGTAFDGETAVERARGGGIDVILMDISLPGISGIEATRQIKNAVSDIKIIILTTFHDRSLVQDAIRAGADGYLLKESTETAIETSIRSVLDGQFLLSPEAAQILAGDDVPEDDEFRPATSNKLSQMSRREQEVFLLMIGGKDNMEISEELCISEHTVRNYVSNIYAILGLKNRTAVILWAQENGLA